MPLKNQVLQFLQDFVIKMDFWGLQIRTDRTNNKNSQTLLALEFSHAHVRQILKELTLEDYSEGPTQDKLYNLSPMWVFGKTIKGREVYIKIQLGCPESMTICISFHFSAHKMPYPFK
jgi:hypothetical protein